MFSSLAKSIAVVGAWAFSVSVVIAEPRHDPRLEEAVKAIVASKIGDIRPGFGFAPLERDARKKRSVSPALRPARLQAGKVKRNSANLFTDNEGLARPAVKSSIVSMP